MTLTQEDRPRIARQLSAVRELMSNGDWWTLDALEVALRERYCLTASGGGLTARIRDLRKERHGGSTIECERVRGGCYRYRMVG